MVLPHLVHRAARNQVGRSSRLQAPHADAGPVVPNLPLDGKDLHRICITGKGLLTPGLGTPRQDHRPGIRIPMIHRQKRCPPARQELVEGMAHISKSEPADCCVLVRHLHGGNLHREGEVGLMVQAVILGPIHFVAGANVQHISALYHREAPGMKGRHRVGSQKPGVVHPLPVLAIPDHPDDLSAVVFLRVFLAKHQKIVLLSRVKSPKQRQLHRQILLGQNIPGPVVSFHRDFLACVLHSGHPAALFLHQARIHRLGCIAPVVVLASIVRRDRCGTCCPDAPGKDPPQERCQNEPMPKSPHNPPSFLMCAPFSPFYHLLLHISSKFFHIPQRCICA